jgi:hypothetical protein
MVISSLQDIFGAYGSLQIFCMDGDPQQVTHKIWQLLQQWGVTNRCAPAATGGGTPPAGPTSAPTAMACHGRPRTQSIFIPVTHENKAPTSTLQRLHTLPVGTLGYKKITILKTCTVLKHG